MRKELLTVAAFAILASPSVGVAQGRGGGPGGGQGAGPPMSPPGQMGGGIGTRDLARDIANQRGQFGRDFADQQRLTAQQRSAMYRMSKGVLT